MPMCDFSDFSFLRLADLNQDLFACLLCLKQTLTSFIIENFFMIYFSLICFGMLLMIPNQLDQ